MNIFAVCNTDLLFKKRNISRNDIFHLTFRHYGQIPRSPELGWALASFPLRTKNTKLSGGDCALYHACFPLQSYGSET